MNTVKDIKGRIPAAAALAVMVVLFLAVTSIPYYYGFVHSPPGTVFSGTVRAHGNTTNYYAMIRQYEKGAVLADNRVTPEAHEGVYFNLQWFIVGRLAGLAGAGFNGTLQAWRVVSIALYIVFMYLLAGLVTDLPGTRLGAVALMSSGGGLGWFFVELYKYTGYRPIPGWWRGKEFPMDTLSTLHPFHQMVISPHQLFAASFFGLGLYFFIRGLDKDDAKAYLIAGLVGVALWLSRPYDGLAFCASVAAYVAVDWFTARKPIASHARALLPVVVSAPAALYNYFSLLNAEGFKGLKSQAYVEPPYPLDMALSIGLLLAVFVYSVRKYAMSAARTTASKVFLVTSLVVLSMVYTYPALIFSFGFTIFLTSVMALFCLSVLAPDIEAFVANGRGMAVAVFAALLVVNSLTSLYIVTDYSKNAAAGKYSLGNDMVSAYQWLGENTVDEDTVLCDLFTSHYLLRYADNRVYYGHHSQTLDAEGKRAGLAKFYGKDTPDSFRVSLLARYRIKYVFYGPGERAYGGFDPAGSGYLRQVFSNSSVRVYKVELGRLKGPMPGA